MKVITSFFMVALLGGEILAKVAIIGHGFGAALCSYYLHKMIPKIKIDIYDHKPFQKCLIRTFVHSLDPYTNEIIQKKGFTTQVVNHEHLPMINDGEEIKYLGVKELTEIDPIGYSKFKEFIEEQMKTFQEIYKHQQISKSFKTVRELLFTLGGTNFENLYTSETILELLNKIEASTEIQKYVKSGLLGTCLSDFNSHAFNGLAMLMFSEITGQILHLDVSEKNLKKLFSKRDNFIENKDILKIIHDPKTRMNSVVSNDNRPIPYDFIILSTTTASKIKFEGFENQINVFDYLEGQTTHVIGDLTEKFEKLPSTMNSLIIINPEKNHTFIRNPHAKMFAISKSAELASKNEISEYVNPYLVHSYVSYDACPDYAKDKLVRNAKFQLDDNLYNVSALDSISMSNEMLAISAKNIALLIKEKISENNTNLSPSEATVVPIVPPSKLSKKDLRKHKKRSYKKKGQ